MKYKLLVSFILTFGLLFGCAPVAPAYSSPQEVKSTSNVKQAVLFATTGASNVYRFQDGAIICYIAENSTLNSAVSIWCN